jgi:hypothetical protein
MVFDWLKRPKSVTTPVADVPIDLHAPIIELDAVVKAYDTAAGPYVALKGIDLVINRGEFVAIVGLDGMVALSHDHGKTFDITPLTDGSSLTSVLLTKAGQPILFSRRGPVLKK